MCLFCNIHGTVESELLARIHGVPVGAVMSLTNLALYGDDGFEAHETELLAMLTADETAAICRELADRLGARVSLASIPGEGAAFSVEVPIEFKGKQLEPLMPITPPSGEVRAERAV